MTPAQKKAAAAAIATALAIPAEGLRRVAYYDPPGILTVCRGHTGPDVVKGRVYSLAECDAFMTQDMREAVRVTYACIPNAPVPVLAAFSDAVFNIGPRIACDTKVSTAARLLRDGNWAAACNELGKWNKARLAGVLVALPGLTKRRAAEKEVCLS
jgi:lysozyme